MIYIDFLRFFSIFLYGLAKEEAHSELRIQRAFQQSSGSDEWVDVHRVSSPLGKRVTGFYVFERRTA